MVKSALNAFLIILTLIGCAATFETIPKTTTGMTDGISGGISGTLPGIIREDIVVGGTVTIRGEIKVLPGAVLTALPGTRFLFEPYDPDGDGVNDSRIVIEGRLVARGEPDAPILFTSASDDPEPGDWLELRMDRSEGSVFEYCILEYSRYGLHAHFSSGIVSNSVLRKNIDGTRLGNSRFEIYHNTIEDNLGKGVNLRASGIIMSNNRIVGNRHGVFVFEDGPESLINLNLFESNVVSDIRFGDFFKGKPPVISGNVKEDGSSLIIHGYDAFLASGMETGGITESLPRVEFNPGPYVRIMKLKEMWTREVGSFIDGSPVFTHQEKEYIAVPTWDSGIVFMETVTGDIVKTVALPNISDSTPLAYKNRLFFLSWDRRVRAVDSETGSVISEAAWEPSLMDDHRQASPVEMDGTIYVGLWKGDFRALDPDTMEWIWSTPLDGAVRGKASIDEGSMWVGTDGGSLYELDPDGEILGRYSMGSPVRAAPVLQGKGNVVVITRDGFLLRLKEGQVKWKRKLPGGGTYASPYLAYNDNIMAGDSTGAVSVFSSVGAPLGRTELGSAVHVLTGAYQGGYYVVAGTENGDVVVISPFGRVMAKIKSGGAVHGILVDEEEDGITIIWGSRDGKVRAYRIVSKVEPWEIVE